MGKGQVFLDDHFYLKLSQWLTKFSFLCNFLWEVSYFLRDEKGPSVVPQCQTNQPMLVQISQDFGTDFVPAVLKALLLAWMVAVIALCLTEHFCPQVVPSAPLQAPPRLAFGASFTPGFSLLQAKVTVWLGLV